MTTPLKSHQEPCMDCVLAASPSPFGLCDKHARKLMQENIMKIGIDYAIDAHDDSVDAFAYTFTTRIYTKEELEENIIRFTRVLLKLKWYQLGQKQHYKKVLREWIREYDNLLRAK